MLAQPPTDTGTLDRIWKIFGSPSDPMPALEERAKELLPGVDLILWEGDAATFEFSYVSPVAAKVLGHLPERWTSEPTFWADTVVHAEDRSDAIAFCAVATGQGRDHDFLYRAVRPDGSVAWLHDVVQVIKGARGVAVKLRGIMLDVTDQIQAEPKA